jgi:O-antigen/teichoic acid export membrane protein
MIVDHSVLRSTGDTTFVFWANVAGFLLSVPAVVLLARAWGLPGAVGGYLVGLIVMRVMGLLKVAQRMDLSWSSVVPVPALARTLTASLVSGGIAATALLLPGRFLPLAVGGTVFSISYAALVLRMRIVPPEEFLALVRRFTPKYPSKSPTA